LKRLTAVGDDVRDAGKRLDVADQRGLAAEAELVRKRRLQTRHAALALHTFEQRGFFAAYVGAVAAMEVPVELADFVLGAGQGVFDSLILSVELAAYIEVDVF